MDELAALCQKPRPALGSSDHNVILLLPKYRQKLKTHKIQTKTIQVLENDSVERLRGCFQFTDLGKFLKACNGDLNMLNESICSYLSFCADSVIPTKQIKHYANNKPWVTRELKHRLNLKEIAFIQDDKQRVKNLTRELKQKTKLAKIKYKDKMENKFTSGDRCEGCMEESEHHDGQNSECCQDTMPRPCCLC